MIVEGLVGFLNLKKPAKPFSFLVGQSLHATNKIINLYSAIF
jgi:hypothetical protein